ncbi:MAG: hypothetical protein LAT68_09260 [Cyclobacteriaceae bacterium]|nr:hypothetical protein [Cyclobacteriaceae bacterium]MCH8516503.1 hypothetical protein [Cyclobacteriaceae bacterium]
MKTKLIVSCLVFYTGCMVLFSCSVPEVDPDAERDARLVGTWQVLGDDEERMRITAFSFVVFTEFGYHNEFNLEQIENERFIGGSRFIWSTKNKQQIITQERRPQVRSGERFVDDYFFSGDTLTIEFSTTSSKYLPAPFEFIYDKNGNFVEKINRD